MGARYPLPLLLLVIAAAAGADVRAQDAGRSPTADSAVAVVRAYLAAYNAHDVPAVVDLLDSSFVWLSAAGDAVAVEVRGREDVRAWLIDYFERFPTARSEAEAMMAVGSLVTVRERASWHDKGRTRSQAALSVYQVHEGRIRRVWYHVATP